MRRSPAAEHLAAPPLARQQLRTARNALNVCSTVPASDYAGIATIAPPPEPREATCECVETKKRRLNGRTLAEACVRLSSLSHSSVRQSGRKSAVACNETCEIFLARCARSQQARHARRACDCVHQNPTYARPRHPSNTATCARSGAIFTAFVRRTSPSCGIFSFARSARGGRRLFERKSAWRRNVGPKICTGA